MMRFANAVGMSGSEFPLFGGMIRKWTSTASNAADLMNKIGSDMQTLAAPWQHHLQKISQIRNKQVHLSHQVHHKFPNCLG